ncbi:MAG: type II secretion system F family protein [Planctomycetales bacterium]|nr:type II secretion system F family protein [Planctomycetales bacterium]
MPKFQYTAWEMSGQQVSGVLNAPSKQDALSSLAARQLFPVSVESSEPQSEVGRQRERRVGARHLVVFYRQLSDLLRSGVPLLRSLELLERQSASPALRSVVQDVREQVADGERLATAMRRHPRVFGQLAVSIVRAGEEGGFLEDVLRRTADFTEHQLELRGRVVGAMIYPAFLMVFMTIVVVAMLVFFVPGFEPIFEQLKEQGELPWATTALMGISDFLARFWFVALIALAAAGYGVSHWVRGEAGRRRFDRFRIRAIGLGPVVRSLAISRFCRILGTLLGNGVPILQSLDIAKDATGNVVLSEAISAASENVSEGKTLAEPLAASGQFPEEVVEMIAVAEEANNLEQVLIDVAESMERRTHRLLDLLVRMLEPLMLTVMAMLVLFVVAALLLPMLRSSSII